MKKLFTIALFALSFNAFAQIPTNGLVAWYPFTNNTIDESSNTNNGTVYGASLSTDRFGNMNSAYSFNGINNFIDIGNNSSLKINGNSISIQAWIMITGNGSQFGRIVIGGLVNTCYTLTKNDGADDRILWRPIIDGQVAGYGQVVSVLPLSRDIWHHIIAIYDGTSSKLYIDGILNNEVTGLTGNLAVNIENAQIGGESHGGTTSAFAGLLDDIRIYNRALTATEVSVLYYEPDFVIPPATYNNSRCGAGTITLTSDGAETGEIYKWYDTSNNGTLLFSETATSGVPSQYTLSLSETDTFYICIDSAGYESVRVPVVASINQFPSDIGDSVSIVYYQQNFIADPGFTSLSPAYTLWGNLSENYWVNTYDNLTNKYWAWSPQFTNADSTKDMIIKMDLNFVHSVFGTYPGVRGYKQNYPDPLFSGINPAFTISSTGTVRKFYISDFGTNNYQLTNVFTDSVWYRVEIHYNASLHKADIIITDLNSGLIFDQLLNANFEMGTFSYIGVGYYDVADWGDDWAPIRIDNIHVEGFAGNLNVTHLNNTICHGDSTSIFIENSQPGISYQCSNDSIIIGNAQTGNADTLTFHFPYSVFNPGNNSITISANDTSTDCLITLDTAFIVTTLLSDTIHLQSAICQYDSIYLGGEWQYNAGTFYDTLQTVLGCDSIIITDLLVTPLPVVDIGNMDTLCYPGYPFSTILNAGNPGATYLWSTGETTQQITINGESLYWPALFTITVEVSYNSCSDTDTLLLWVDMCEGIKEIQNKSHIKIYPNPTSQILTIESVNNEAISGIKLSTIDGRQILDQSNSSDKSIIDMKCFTKGIYFLKIITEKGQIVKKIIKN